MNPQNRNKKKGTYSFKGVIDMAKKAEFEETLPERQARAEAAQKKQGLTNVDRQKALVSMVVLASEQKLAEGKIDRVKFNVIKNMAKKSPKKLAKMVEDSLK